MQTETGSEIQLDFCFSANNTTYAHRLGLRCGEIFVSVQIILPI